ncbi:uncharacterized protein [Mytilus edulis]|uniref:uncharacterized protein n=1 Tax=Mytilus edulis TaxID=6550 RepID=UPI0039EE1B72
MGYLKLTILVITVVIGLQHGPVYVSCQVFPPPPGLGFRPPGSPFFVPPGGRLLPIPVPRPVPVPILRDRSDESRIVQVNDEPRPFGPFLPWLLLIICIIFHIPLPFPITTTPATTQATTTPPGVTVLVTLAP